MRLFGSVTSILLCVCLAPVTVAQQSTGSAAEEVVTARPLVLFDVIVTDKSGKPITTLKPEDFTIYEDGQLQKVASFKLVQPTASAANPVPSAANVVNDKSFQLEDTRNIILVDAVTSNWTFQAKAPKRPSVFLKRVIDFIEHMPLNQPLAICVLLPGGGQVIQNFTVDRGSIYAAAAKLADELARKDAVSVSEEMARGSMTAVLNPLLSGLGRKNLIIISENLYEAFPRVMLRKGLLTMPPTPGEAQGQVVSVLFDSQVVTYVVDPRGKKASDEYRALAVNGSVTYAVEPGGKKAPDKNRTLVVNGSVTYAVDPGGKKAPDEYRALVVNGSGYQDFNLDADKAEAICYRIENGSTYYWIGYFPTNQEWTRHFREFRSVQIKVNRQDAVVRQLVGYQASPPSTLPAPRAKGNSQ